MSNTLSRIENGARISDRRIFSRHRVRSLAYIELGDGNGGIILNVSQGGIAVQAVMSLASDRLPRLRFQVSHSKTKIEAAGRLAWSGEFRKLAGLEFVDLSPEARSQIQEWISLEAPPDEPAETSPAPPETTSAELELPGAALSDRSSAQATAAPLLASLSPADASETKPKSGSGVSPYWGESPNRRRLAIIAGIFAASSLAAIWVAERGVFRVFEKTAATKSGFQEGSAVHEPMETTASASASAPQIEIVGLNNQRWLIPFDGSITRQATGNVTAPIRKNSLDFQIWTLSPPVRRSSEPAGDAPEVAPLSAGPEDSRQSVLPSTSVQESGSGISIPPPPAPREEPKGGTLQPVQLIQRVEPVYPPDAASHGIEGTVQLHIVIGQTGMVKAIESTTGPRLLIPAAIAAVRKWRFSPAVLDGHPIQTDAAVSVVFRLPQSR